MLRELCEVIPGRHIVEENHNRSQRGVPYLTGPSDFGSQQAAASRWTEKPDVMCAPNDVLVTVKGAGVAKVNFAPPEPACIGRQLMAIRAKPGKTNASFIFFALQWAQEQLKSQATGATVPGLSIEDLEDLHLPNPPIEKHEPIAARLREQFLEAERTRAAAAAQMQAAKALQAAFLRAVFSGPAIKGWAWSRVADLAETCSGTTPSRGRSDYYRGSIPWVKTGELLDGVITETEEKVTEAALKETSLRLLPEETVLIAMYGQGQTRGRTGILKCEATTNQACFAILPNGRFSPSFLQFWFRHSYLRLRTKTESRGGNQPNLNGDVLRNEMVPSPDLREQQVIVDGLTAELFEASQLQGHLTQKLAAVEKLPVALLREAFSGRI